MRLPVQDIERFYHIWFEILHYVNTQLNLVPDFPSVPEENSITMDVAIQLRDALWANDDVRERFLVENPAQLSGADLAIVASWQYRIVGSFTIARSLKKYTIFLPHTAPVHAYGVLGLVSVIEDTLPLPLPVYAQAVLLPFEHHIIYDSLLTPYNIVLGPGIQRGLQEEYRMLQEREGIITSLLPEDQMISITDRRKEISARNHKVSQVFQRELRKNNLSERMVALHAATIEDFANKELLEADPPHGILDLTAANILSYLKEHPDKQSLTSFKRFIRFLLQTGRINYEVGEDLNVLLKQIRSEE